jgi:hypothetical protein
LKTKGYGRKNDFCENGDFCGTGLSCKNTPGVCLSDLPDGECTTPVQCNWNEYCDGKNCKPLPGLGESCSSQNCKYRSRCNSGICVEEHTIDLDGSCTDTVFCKPGLQCIKRVCAKPIYRILSGYGAAWGQECLPTDPGCRCNSGLGIFQYLKESSVVYYSNCPDKKKDFEACMIAKGCTYINDGHDTCLRRFCYPQFAALDSCNTDPSLVPLRCGATSIVIAGLMLVFLLLL